MEDTIFYLTAWMEASCCHRNEFTHDDMCAFAEWYHQKREQERQGPAPDRDEMAMNMPVYYLPQLKDATTFEKVCKKLGIECDASDPESFIKASLEYDARMRYIYADTMLKARKVN